MKKQRQRVAAYALMHENGNILLCRLSKEIPEWEGAWTLPGGGIEHGESPDDAVVREVKEETGLIVRPESIAGIDSLFISRDYEDLHGIRIIYLVSIIGGNLKNEISGSTDLCEWHPIENLSELSIVELVEAGIKMLKKSQQNQK